MQNLIASVQELGVLVRAARKSADIRLDDLAATVGISKQALSNLELGKEGVRLGSALKVLNELGLHVFVDMPDSTEAQINRSHQLIERTNSRRSSRKDKANGQ